MHDISRAQMSGLMSSSVFIFGLVCLDCHCAPVGVALKSELATYNGLVVGREAEPATPTP